MKTCFNVPLEFDPQRVDEIIHAAIEKKEKGYVCSIESNNLTYANLHPEFREVVGGSLVNLCDGSNIARLLGLIHRQPYRPYIGADLFIKYIMERRYRQYFLGNTRPVLNGLRALLSLLDPGIRAMKFEELPFRKVDEFDYAGIAGRINSDRPDIIWVSLGAPKQEQFMSRLLPYLDQGVMFGFGAIFNFYSAAGPVRRAPSWMLRLRLEWLYRAIEEPGKNVPRYWSFLKILPRLIRDERRNKKRNEPER